MSSKSLRWVGIAILVILTLVQAGCLGTSVSPAESQPISTVGPTITLRLFTRTPIVFASRTPTPNDGMAHIAIGDNYFEPAIITIKIRTVVEWWHGGNGTHTITSLQDKWPTIFPAYGSRHRVSFDAPGLYTYVCAFHSGMGGTIKVED